MAAVGPLPEAHRVGARDGELPAVAAERHPERLVRALAEDGDFPDRGSVPDAHAVSCMLTASDPSAFYAGTA